ncbi:MAG: GNAT family N-acetyltransferase [Actinomycetota bacterium]|nr:GNAT family N-acetyltransferase [Actinomycetota bacterium]
MRSAAAADRGLPLPDPPLADDVVALRPWRQADAPSLAAAWADPEIRRWTEVPPDTSEAFARRWIAGEAERRRRGLAVDLVMTPVDDEDRVAGEIGLVMAGRGAAEMGYWTASDRRGLGYASRGAGLVRAWALHTLGVTELVAKADPGNRTSATVARNAGFAVDPGDPSGATFVARRIGD